jgi:hypothetical protein
MVFAILLLVTTPVFVLRKFLSTIFLAFSFKLLAVSQPRAILFISSGLFQKLKADG